MKRFFKPFISVILSLTMLVSCLITASAAGEKERQSRRVSVPVVYVAGLGGDLYADTNDKNSEIIYDGTEVSEETFNKLLKGFMKPLTEAIKTDNWDVYSDFIVDTLSPDLGRFGLDENGEASNGTGNDWKYNKNVKDKKGQDGMYDLYSYKLPYDWRADPVEVADRLNEFIINVKKATGYSKVNLTGRCLGGNVVMAYLYKYGWDDINALELYVGMFEGQETAGALFSGNVTVEPEAVSMYIQRKLPDDGAGMSLMKSIVVLLDAVNGLNLPINLVHKVYNNVYQNVIPRLMKISFGTCPSYWSFISDEYYDDAKELIFGGEEEKFAELIKKADYFHYNILSEFKNIIKNGLNKGVNIYNFAKYGDAMVPVCKSAKYQNDGVTGISSQTFGTIGSETGKTFGYKYLAEAEKSGNIKYISPDKRIDASADLLRDHTWFIRGCPHGIMPKCIDYLMADIFEANGFGESSKYITTDYFENYPQFLIASDESKKSYLIPMTEETIEGTEPWHKNIFEHLLFIIEKIFNAVFEIMNAVNRIVTEIKA